MKQKKTTIQPTVNITKTHTQAEAMKNDEIKEKKNVTKTTWNVTLPN